jgi:hypothetical protein
MMAFLSPRRARACDCGQRSPLRRVGLAMTATIRKRVGACMWKLKQAGYAREEPIAGELKGWMRAE